jgi:hypothetical protein
MLSSKAKQKTKQRSNEKTQARLLACLPACLFAIAIAIVLGIIILVLSTPDRQEWRANVSFLSSSHTIMLPAPDQVIVVDRLLSTTN